MSDYEIGYGKPPAKSRFPAGVSGNPKGRPRRKPFGLAEIIGGALNAPIEYRDKDRIRAISRHELILKMLIDRAVKGNLKYADLVLKIRAHGERFGEVGVSRLLVTDWLPDYFGQTADQKTQEFASTGDADPVAWWLKARE
jgi:hypothetical protein